MKTRRVRLACSTLALLLLVGATDALGAVVRQAELAQLVSSSAIIFHGVVSGVDESPESLSGQFVTEIQCEVIESIAGLEAHKNTFSFVVPGGQRGTKSLVIPGMPRFLPGDEVVLLLEEVEGRGGWVFTGLAQGVFWVRRDGLVPQVFRNLSELTLVRESEHVHGGVERPRSLYGLLETLHKLVRGATP